ncbi:hypothetical protein V8E54_007106 [Elaphomyces granulatus]
MDLPSSLSENGRGRDLLLFFLPDIQSNHPTLYDRIVTDLFKANDQISETRLGIDTYYKQWVVKKARAKAREEKQKQRDGKGHKKEEATERKIETNVGKGNDKDDASMKTGQHGGQESNLGAAVVTKEKKADTEAQEVVKYAQFMDNMLTQLTRDLGAIADSFSLGSWDWEIGREVLALVKFLRDFVGRLDFINEECECKGDEMTGLGDLTFRNLAENLGNARRGLNAKYILLKLLAGYPSETEKEICATAGKVPGATLRELVVRMKVKQRRPDLVKAIQGGKRADADAIMDDIIENIRDSFRNTQPSTTSDPADAWYPRAVSVMVESEFGIISSNWSNQPRM